MLSWKKTPGAFVLLALTCFAPSAWAGTVGGTVSGLNGVGLVLQNNGTDKLAIKSNGPFTFRTILPDRSKYNVTVQQQPIDPAQVCTVQNGSGIVRGNITNIAVVCSSTSVARFAYTANADGTVSVYSVDQATGQLQARSYVDTQFSANTITVDAADRFAYVTQGNSDNVIALSINPASGALTPIPGQASQHTGRRPFASAIDKSGRFLYVTNATSNTISPFTINATTGALTPIDGGTLDSGGQGPFGIFVHPSLPFLFVMNETSSNIATFLIDSGSGRLTLTSVAPDGVNALPFEMASDPLGRFLYVANGNTRNVAAFSIGSNGVLTQIPGSPYATPSFPVTIGVDPEGKFVYVGNTRSSNPGSPPSGVSGFTINPTTGALTSIPGSPFAAQEVLGDLTIDPSGHYVYLTSGIGIGPVPNAQFAVSTLAINRSTGALLPVGKVVRGRASLNIVTTKGAQPLAFKPKFVYVAHSLSHSVTAFRVNPQTGALTASTSSPNLGTIASVAADPSGRFVYVASTGEIIGATGTLTGMRIDQTSGALTTIFSSPFGSLLSAIAVDPSSQFVYVADRSNDTITRFKVDAGSGVISAPIASSSAGDPIAIAIDPAGLTAFGVNASTSRLAAYDIARLPLVNGAQRGQLLLFSDFGNNPYLTGANPASAAVDPTGRFIYTANLSSDTVSGFFLNPLGGALTAVPGSPRSTSGFCPAATATESSGGFLYVANQCTSTIDAFAINPATGALTPVPGSPFATGNQPVSIGTDLSGSFLYVANSLSNDVSVYTINRATGGLSQVAGSPFPTGGLRPVSLTVVGATE